METSLNLAKARARYHRNRIARLAVVHKYRAANKDKVAAASRAYNLGHRAEISRYNKAYRQRNKEKIKCHRIMWKAIRAGELVIGPCVHEGLSECSPRIQGHHDRHDKPLDVTWFCTSHHQQHHRSDLVFVEGCMTSEELQELIG